MSGWGMVRHWSRYIVWFAVALLTLPALWPLFTQGLPATGDGMLHLQRLMVLGNFALLAGAHPYQFHQWHMAMYNDAIDWVSLPNTLGMSQFGDGGVVGSKPYISTGNYINRMSNFCQQCPRNPAHASGDTACPFSTLYWDFLDRHQARLRSNPRLAMQYKQLDRKRDSEAWPEIQQQAAAFKEELVGENNAPTTPG